jgi:dihydroxyacetone kinase
LTGRVQLPGETDLKDQDKDSLKIEVGLGIHGETGRIKMNLPTSTELAQLTFNDYLIDPKLESSEDQEIILMINNLGGLSNLELCLFANDCVKYLMHTKQNIKIARIYCGTFMTSLSII